MLLNVNWTSRWEELVHEKKSRDGTHRFLEKNLLRSSPFEVAFLFPFLQIVCFDVENCSSPTSTMDVFNRNINFDALFKFSHMWVPVASLTLLWDDLVSFLMFRNRGVRLGDKAGRTWVAGARPPQVFLLSWEKTVDWNHLLWLSVEHDEENSISTYLSITWNCF